MESFGPFNFIKMLLDSAPDREKDISRSDEKTPPEASGGTSYERSCDRSYDRSYDAPCKGSDGKTTGTVATFREADTREKPPQTGGREEAGTRENACLDFLARHEDFARNIGKKK